MTTPKHLWSGDWEEESEAAAARRRGMAPLPDAPEPDRPEPPRAPAPRPEPHPAPHRGPERARRLRSRRWVPWRAAGIASLTAIVIVAAALALTALLSPGKDQAATRLGWLGVKLGVLPGSTVVITGFERGSPGRAAGLRTGDLITEVQSRPVAAPVDVRLAVEALREGDTIELGVQRGSHPYTVRVRLGGRSAHSSP